MDAVGGMICRTAGIAVLSLLFLALSVTNSFASQPVPATSSQPVSTTTAESMGISASEYARIVRAANAAGISEAQVAADVDHATRTTTPHRFPGVVSMSASVRVNGCSNPVPGHGYQNALFDADCNAHDVCYVAEGDAGRSRAQCDSEFRNAMNATCTRTYGSTGIEHKRCIGTASYYYWMVRAFGAPYFKG
ncbi:hypothetical protein [Kocuria marina]|uniref:hypothetical protein n=1 Tax=Kocuria marina TaxID=223184 RepID=UPI0022E62624|nr:hypothetical protein [Kocuria marina]